MTKLERAYDDIHNDGIAVYNYSLSDAKKAACYSNDGDDTILINRAVIHSNAEELTIVAEEHAHYEIGAFYELCPSYNESHKRTNRMIAESKARRHAMHKCVPYDELVAVFMRYVHCDGDVDIYGLAEHFEVPPEYIRQTINHYHEIGHKW